MQKLESDPNIQKKIDHVVRKFEWDKKWKEEGREEGREEGIEKARLEMARTLLKDGSSLGYISKVTGLTIDRIKQLNQK
ncbi:hypothetical protein [Salicibibacter cibarius]|nr:hypothetical protein [Salicibibacter cibarius]